MKKYLLGLLVILAFGIVYLSFIKSGKPDTGNRENPDQTVVGGDRDENGCIGSAGYTWCAEKGKCLREWEESCTGTPTPYEETEIMVKGAVKDLLVKKHGESAKNLDVTVSAINGNYARGSANEMGTGGGLWFAAKTAGEWKLVWDGNGIITCKDLVPFPDFPTDMIPQCFDDSKGEMVKR